MNSHLKVMVIGIGASLVVDAWSILRRLAFGVPAADFALVGRWLGHLAGGRFRHPSIAKATAVRGELALGWIAHFAIGIAFAAALVALAGTDWLSEPALLPALLVGIGTVLVPFLIVQPAMGAGVAASRTPNPAAARLQALVTHGIFGLGLFATALVLDRALSGAGG